MKFTLRDRQSLLLGDERIINDSGRTIQLVVPRTSQHCRVDKRPYPKQEQDLETPDSQPG